MILLQVNDLSISYLLSGQKMPVISGASFTLRAGETLGLIGESGSGKTSLALALAGLLKPNEVQGSILYQNEELLPIEEQKWRRIRGKEIGFIPQHPMNALTPTLRLGDQVGEPLFYHGLSDRKELKRKTLELFDLAGIDEPELRFDQYPHMLSGGLKQRALIAMAASCRPKLLIADEPTTALDAPLKSMIIDLLQNLQRRFNMGLIVISHDGEVISRLTGRALILQDGRLSETKVYRKNEVIFLPRKTSASSEKIPLLEVCGLSVSYPQKNEILKAVDSVSFSLYSGETLGLLGESGAGKSTLAKALLELVPRSSGFLYFQGRKLVLSKERSMRRHLGLAFQDPLSSLNPTMSIRRLLEEPFLIHKISCTEAKLKGLLDLVSLPSCFLNRFPHTLSGGQRQRVALARALALSPKLLMFDEPISSLDQRLQEHIVELLQKLQNELDLAYLFITHDLKLARSFCTHLAVMHKGKLVEYGATERLFKEPRHSYTKWFLREW